jgi:hypothetical protein
MGHRLFYQQIHRLDEHSSYALHHSALSLTDLDINEFGSHHHLSHNPPNPSALDTQILSTAMSKFLACAPTSSPIYSLALSTPLESSSSNPQVKLPHFSACALRVPSRKAAFLHHHLRCPRPPLTSEGSLPLLVLLGDLRVTAFSSSRSCWLSNPPPLDTRQP